MTIGRLPKIAVVNSLLRIETCDQGLVEEIVHISVAVYPFKPLDTLKAYFVVYHMIYVGIVLKFLKMSHNLDVVPIFYFMT